MKAYKKNIGLLILFIFHFLQVNFETECIAFSGSENKTKVGDPNNIRQEMEYYSSVWKNGLKEKERTQRMQAVDKLIEGLKTPQLHDFSAKLLLYFQASDYSEHSKVILSRMLSSNPEYYTILLVGAANLEAEKDKLGTIIDKIEGAVNPFNKTMEDPSKESHSLAFAALMARARMGSKKDIAHSIQVVDACKDKQFKSAVLFERLSYVRQPEVIEYLLPYLFSEEFEPGEASIKVTYAQRAAMALSRMLEGFPGNEEYGGNKETIDKCRKWMKETDWSKKIIR